MLGTIHVVPPAHGNLHRIIQTETAPCMVRLAQFVGGWPKLVPDFNTMLARGGDGETEPCLVFCNEAAERRELTPNTWANLLWLQAQVRTHGFAGTNRESSILFGPVAIVHGDAEFLRSLTHNVKELLPS